MRSRLIVVLLFALSSLAVAEEDPAKRAAALERALFPRAWDPAPAMDDMNSLRMIVGLVEVQSATKYPWKDGALHVYRLYEVGDITDKRLSVFRSARTGIGPSLKEVKKGDYTHFPYERYKGAKPPPKGALEAIPLIWDRVASPRGQRLVGYNGGSVELVPEAQLLALLEKHGQLTSTYAKAGLSFVCPRYLKIGEKPPAIFVDDPATGDKDLVIMNFGKQNKLFFAGVIEGLKKGLRAETIVEETEIKEQIGDAEVAGRKIVYIRKGEKRKRILRFVIYRDSLVVLVSTTLKNDALRHAELQPILRSIKIEETPPPKEEETEFD